MIIRRTPFFWGVFFFTSFVVLAMLFAAPGDAHEYSSGDITVDHPSSRATPPGVSVGVGYMKITNGGPDPETLTGASTPLAQAVQLHRSVERDGVMQMIGQHDGIVTPAHGSVELAPGGYHLMLMALKRPLKKGDAVPLTLMFERTGSVEVMLEVEAIGGEGGIRTLDTG